MKLNIFLLTYIDDNGKQITIAVDYLMYYKSGKIKGKVFSRNLYTLIGIRYGAQTIIKKNLTYSEVMEYMRKQR